MAKISVIIPVYNVEDYLNKCLDSIINQTFKDIEIICVNDGSKDNSLQIVKEYAQKDNRIKIVDKENGGLSSARNAGLEVATSEWISFIDSDDWLDIDTFEKLEKIFELNPDIICFGTHLRGEVAPEIASADAEYYRIKHTGLVELNDEIRETTDVATWNKLYKKSIIDKFNLRFPMGKHYEDYPFYWEYMFEAKTAFYTEEKFYNYLRRPNSIMANTFNQKSEKVIDHLYAAETIFNYCQKRGILEEHLETFAEIFMNCFWFSYDHSPKKRKTSVLFQATELLNKFALGNDFNDKWNNINFLKAGQYWKIGAIDYDKNIWQKIFSIKNRRGKKIVKILGLKFSFKPKVSILINKIDSLEDENNFLKNQIKEIEKYNLSQNELVQNRINEIETSINTRNELINGIFVNLNIKTNILENMNKNINIENLLEEQVKPYNRCYLDTKISYINYLFKNAVGSFDNSAPEELFPNFFYTCGTRPNENNAQIIAKALLHGKQPYIIEDCFLRSIFSVAYKNIDHKYQKSIGFTIDDLTSYYDANFPSRLELMLNNKDIVISEEQKQRARACIDKIVETHLTKYNNQPIYEPKIGREGVKKVLVVDQSYGDMSIARGGGSDIVFKDMLQSAIDENPDADIIVKTHPDTMSGTRGGYYTGLKQHDNIYPMTEPINPISLIKYVDKVYVCTTQFGFEALMCGKDVHVFGMPFYAGWGLTHDRQKCERRTNTRTLEEVFYIAYIMYSYYVNPDKKCRCEIEKAMDYLLKLRDEYFRDKGVE